MPTLVQMPVHMRLEVSKVPRQSSSIPDYSFTCKHKWCRRASGWSVWLIATSGEPFVFSISSMGGQDCRNFQTCDEKDKAMPFSIDWEKGQGWHKPTAG